jgi:tRNA nucleotidyltransferase (CCA-adding enzyme)
MKNALLQATKLVVPSKKSQHEKNTDAKKAFLLVSKQISKYPEIIDAEFGGSYSKGTWLPDKADIDIFIKFKKLVPEKKFTEIARKVGFDALKQFKPYVRYSEHPYVEATIRKTKVNVVPCYDVKIGKWQSSADRSPFHTVFMLESLSGQMKDDVRLLKAFLKSNEIYGAEIARQGFSGYVAEVLVWNFRSFENVVKSIAKIKSNEVIGKSSKKFDTSVVIMDPIDSNRNLAAAISEENIGKFVLSCRAFLRNPSINYFKSKPRKISEDNLENVLLVSFNYKPRSPDIIAGQIKRAAGSLAIQLELGGFKVLRYNTVSDDNKANLLFLMQSLEIPENYVKDGPEFFGELDSNSFVSKNVKKSKLMWVGKNKKIHSLEKRKFNTAKKFLDDVLKNQINKSGIPKGLESDIKKGYRIITGKKTVSKSIKEAISELVSTNGAIFSSN